MPDVIGPYTLPDKDSRFCFKASECNLIVYSIQELLGFTAISDEFFHSYAIFKRSQQN